MWELLRQEFLRGKAFDVASLHQMNIYCKGTLDSMAGVFNLQLYVRQN